jgi:hypothetical protein
MSAFSGEVAKNFDEYKDSILHIQTRVSNLNSCILHIEPESNQAESFHKKLLTLINKIMGRIRISEGKSDKKGFLWVHSLNNKSITGQYSIRLFKRYG